MHDQPGTPLASPTSPPTASLEKQRAIAVFGLFSKFCRRYSDPSAKILIKDIIDFVHEKKLLSRTALKTMVYLVHRPLQIQLGYHPSQASSEFPVVILHERNQPYTIVHAAIEDCIELWASSSLHYPGAPYLELERDPSWVGVLGDPCANPAFEDFTLGDLPTPNSYAESTRYIDAIKRDC
jgi:hypothetical protein